MKKIWGWLLRWTWRSMTILFALLVLYQVWLFAHICWWVKFNPSSSAFMDTRLEIMQDKNPDAELRHKWVPYASISNNLKRALVAAEDAKFVDHEGFDWEGIQKAYEKNLKRGKVVAGGSTISQQLAKNLFLSGSRSWLRKGQEAAITWMLESMMAKRRIFELYLNLAEWGDGVFGAEAAARHYFGVSATQLSRQQAAWLAAILPAPQRYDRNRGSAWIAKKATVILARMPAAQIP